MILVTVTKLSDGSFDVNHWKQTPSVWKIPARKGTLKKTHDANVKIDLTAAQIEYFRMSPPEALRIK